MSCIAYGCFNTTSSIKLRKQSGKENLSKITFHRFPKDPSRRDKWLSAIGREGWTPTSSSFVCSVHFTDDCFDKTSLCVVRLKEHAVPTIFPPPNPKTFGRKVSRGRPRKLGVWSETETPYKKESINLPACSSAGMATSGVENSHLDLYEVVKLPDDSDFGDYVFEELLQNANRLSLPFGWARNIPVVGPRAVIYTQFTSRLVDGRVLSVIYKQVCVDEHGCATCYVYGKRVGEDHLPLPSETLQSTEQLQELLVWLDLANICKEAENCEVQDLDSSNSCQSASRYNCELIVTQGWRCLPCSQWSQCSR